jgi:hypothetical protein
MLPGTTKCPLGGKLTNQWRTTGVDCCGVCQGLPQENKVCFQLAGRLWPCYILAPRVAHESVSLNIYLDLRTQ